MIERNERALARAAVTESRSVRPAGQLRPVAVDDLGKAPHQRVRHLLQEGRVGLKVGEGLRLELEAFAAEVVVDEGEDGTLGHRGAAAGRRVEGCERGQDRARVRIRGLVDERLLVRVEIGDVDGLQDLQHSNANITRASKIKIKRK